MLFAIIEYWLAPSADHFYLVGESVIHIYCTEEVAKTIPNFYNHTHNNNKREQFDSNSTSSRWACAVNLVERNISRRRKHESREQSLPSSQLPRKIKNH